jgi:hypothetical protein
MWPLYGLLMGLAAAAIAWVLAPTLFDFVRRRSPNFRIGTLTEEQVLLFFGIIIFLVLISIGTLIVAVSAPRKKSRIRETDVAKERAKIEAARRARKKRQRELNRKMRESNQRLDM